MRHRRTKVLISICVVLLLYCGSYLWLRHRHYFIHRAGLYGAEPPKNHYIELGEIADGPQIFGSVVFQFAASGKEPKPGELEAALSAVAEQVTVEERRRKRWLIFFKPLAAAEEIVWQIVKPHPNVP